MTTTGDYPLPGSGRHWGGHGIISTREVEFNAVGGRGPEPPAGVSWRDWDWYLAHGQLPDSPFPDVGLPLSELVSITAFSRILAARLQAAENVALAVLAAESGKPPVQPSPSRHPQLRPVPVHRVVRFLKAVADAELWEEAERALVAGGCKEVIVDGRCMPLLLDLLKLKLASKEHRLSDKTARELEDVVVHCHWGNGGGDGGDGPGGPGGRGPNPPANPQ